MYCQEFIDLINEDFKNNVIDGWGQVFAKSLKSKNDLISSYVQKVGSSLLHINFKENEKFNLPIGLGNPNADLLIIGKDSTDDIPKLSNKYLDNEISGSDYLQLLFLNETYLNYYSWKLLDDDYFLNVTNNITIQNPKFPSSFLGLFNREKTSNHKWFLINKLVQKKLGHSLDFRSSSFDTSFFKHVFLTDVNIVQSSTSNSQLDQHHLYQRFNFLTTNKFYSKFPLIIFANFSYLEKRISYFTERIQDIYKVLPQKNFRPTKNIRKCFCSNERKIYFSSQFSIGAGWKNSELQRFFL